MFTTMSTKCFTCNLYWLVEWFSLRWTTGSTGYVRNFHRPFEPFLPIKKIRTNLSHTTKYESINYYENTNYSSYLHNYHGPVKIPD